MKSEAIEFQGFDLWMHPPFTHTIGLMDTLARLSLNTQLARQSGKKRSSAPRIGRTRRTLLVVSDSGAGKTTAARYFCGRNGHDGGVPTGCYVQAVSPGEARSAFAMLQEICSVLIGGGGQSYPWVMVRRIAENLLETNRFLVIDNAHHLARYRGSVYNAFDVLRDIHDRTYPLPLVLVGLEDLEKSWSSEVEFSRRTWAVWHMRVPSREELASFLPFHPDVVEEIWTRSHGNMGEVEHAYNLLLDTYCSGDGRRSGDPEDITLAQARATLRPHLPKKDKSGP